MEISLGKIKVFEIDNVDIIKKFQAVNVKNNFSVIIEMKKNYGEIGSTSYKRLRKYIV